MNNLDPTQWEPSQPPPVESAGTETEVARFQALVELLPDAVIVVDTAGHTTLMNQQAEALFGYGHADLLGQPIERLIPQRFRQAHSHHRARYAAAPVKRPMGTGLQLFGRRRDGSEFPVEVSLSPVPEFGTADGFAVLATIYDISEHLRVERARSEAEAATDELRRVQAITDVGLSHHTLDDLLPALLTRLSGVLGVDNAAILLLSTDEHTLTVRAVHGLEAAVAADVRVPVGEGFAGQIAASRAPLVIDDLHTFPVVTPLLREQLCSVLGVPLLVDDRLIGVLHVGTATPYFFTERETRLLQLVAERISLAIDQARLHDAEQAAIAQARQQEARAAQLAAQLQAIFDAMADLVFVYDSAGQILRMNSAAREALGLAEDKAAERAFSALSPPERWARAGIRTQVGEPMPVEDLPELRLLRGEVLPAAAPQELHMIDAAERERVLSFTGGPVNDDEGNRLGYVLVSHDITAHWQLGQQVHFQASLLERTHDAIFVWELRGPLVFWNQGAELLFGYRSSEVLGQMSHDLLRTHLPEAAADFVARLQREGEWIGELTHTTRDGQVVDVLSRLQVLRVDGLPSVRPRDVADGGSSGAHLYVCETALDITKSKVLARQREEATARALAASEVTQHLDEFFQAAAHDIRNPISVVKVGAQLALRRFEKVLAASTSPAPTMGPIAASSAAEAALPPHASGDRAGGDRARELAARLEALRESLEAVEDSTDRLTRLTVQLFDVARARTGTLELELAPCDLLALVREQVTSQRLAIPDRTMQLELPRDRQIVIVLADAVRMSQVLANYLTNALKYSADEKPVTIALEVTDGLAVVWVRDEGPGLPKAEQSQVWELSHRAPSVQVQSRLGTTSGSLGLGLHICKHIVELHPGGQVGVDSEVGQGSTFWFRLPVSPQEPKEQQEVQQASSDTHLGQPV